MKRLLSVSIAVALIVVFQSPATASKAKPKPSTGTIFYASGQFDDGYALSGTVTIDTTTGEALAADLVIGDNFAVFKETPATYINAAGDVEIVVEASLYSGIVLVVPATSLKGYAGGSLVANDSYWFWPVYYFGSYGGSYLLSGSLEPK